MPRRASWDSTDFGAEPGRGRHRTDALPVPRAAQRAAFTDRGQDTDQFDLGQLSDTGPLSGRGRPSGGQLSGGPRGGPQSDRGRLNGRGQRPGPGEPTPPRQGWETVEPERALRPLRPARPTPRTRQPGGSARFGGQGRQAGPSRRAITIAAVTTGTIAVSTAAFAAAGPGTDTGSTEAALVGGNGTTTSAPEFLAIAQQVAVTQPTSTGLTITPNSAKVRPAKPVVLTVRASAADGTQPLANQSVRVLVANGNRWATTAILHTDNRGLASITAHLLTTTKITVAFDGTGALRPAVASATTVTVYDPTVSSGLDMADIGLTNAPGSTIGSKAVYLASLQRGKPYVWGASGPYSFDCSGLVQYVFKQLGRSLPRTADSQYYAATHIAQSAKQPGDLIFFGAPGSIYHVAIYAGNGYIWQAPQTGETVQLVPIWSSSYLVGRVM